MSITHSRQDILANKEVWGFGWLGGSDDCFDDVNEDDDDNGFGVVTISEADVIV